MKQIPTNLDEEIKNSFGRKIFGDFLELELKKPELLPCFDVLTKLYFEVNSIINISALRAVDDIYIKHYLDSLYPLSEFRGKTVCDVGCGGGFPSIPLAIASDFEVTGLDSVGKKLKLIELAVSALKLNNLKSEHARSEDFAKKGNSFDTVCARALADINTAVTFCAPLVNQHGRLILYRTQNDDMPKSEILNKFEFSAVKVKDYELSGTGINRRVYIFER